MPPTAVSSLVMGVMNVTVAGMDRAVIPAKPREVSGGLILESVENNCAGLQDPLLVNRFSFVGKLPCRLNMKIASVRIRPEAVIHTGPRTQRGLPAVGLWATGSDENGFIRECMVHVVV
jgi:hypothetical protein